MLSHIQPTQSLDTDKEGDVSKATENCVPKDKGWMAVNIWNDM